jgi:hypothetical protein
MQRLIKYPNRRGHAYLRLIGWRRRNIAGSIAA